MSGRAVTIAPSWAAFRRVARELLAGGVPPAGVVWHATDGGRAQLSLLDGPAASTAPAEPTARLPEPAHAELTPSGEAVASVPRRFLTLGEVVACHRDPAPWPCLYRVLWRLAGGERALLEDVADPDVIEFERMHRAVERDAHKMRAFVRFRSVSDAAGERFVAWFEPRHRIVRHTAPFFERRFPSMRWSILTPDDCVHWDGEALAFTAGMPASRAPAPDALEAFWLTYYAHTFNPARVRVGAMRAEMPVRYWRNLPETAAIPALLRQAPARVRTMLERSAAAASRPEAPVTAADAAHGHSAEPQRAMQPVLGPPAAHAPARVPKVRVGVAGWDYPDWAGCVYPAGRDGVDRLRWVAARFDLIEVNSTFYRPASPRATRSWLERTRDRPELRFAAKLFRGFTHERGAWRNADVAAVRAGMQPLLDADRLSSLLVQFPWSFRNRPDERRVLQRIVTAFTGLPLHVEVRHASWDDAAFRDWLAGRGVGLANIDQPLLPGSLAPASEATSRTAYLRLHGRNAGDWFRADATRDERYDYDYGADELAPWAERAAALAARPDIDDVLVVFNNHYRAQAVTNAETFARMLAG